MNRMDDLIRSWTSQSRHDRRIDQNALLLQFLGTWLYSQYQPFPEKPPFWDRLFAWLDHIPNDNATRDRDQQALFNFVPWLLFVGEEDLIAAYRAAYTGPICRWLIDSASIGITHPDLNDKISEARRSTWFGSLAGMDINTFCRVNGIFGQSYRPEFRFVSEFCKITPLKKWLKQKCYRRIVIVEDIVGTGEQFKETVDALIKLKPMPILFVPLFIAPDGLERVQNLIEGPQCRHIQCQPLFVLPHECLVRRDQSPQDSKEINEFRSVNQRVNAGHLGFGSDYGTLVLTHANCPDNIPPIIHERTDMRPVPLFPRASREG